mmetsp:Transcript_47871/g.136322  ORF Transcript_47871/g.136322 Transcript_47871/m.136322 type:complete len:208 (-) Transcript_47871:10-633(-)
MAEGELARGAEGDADGAVLRPRALLVEGAGVVVEGLPVGAVAVPVEASGPGVLRDGEILAHPAQHVPVLRRAARVLRDEMRALMPRHPLGISLTIALQLTHLLDQHVVRLPVVLIAEKLRNDDDVVMPDWPPVALASRPDDDAHRRPHQRGGRVEGHSVSTRQAHLAPRRALCLANLRSSCSPGVVFDGLKLRGTVDGRAAMRRGQQ